MARRHLMKGGLVSLVAGLLRPGKVLAAAGAGGATAPPIITIDDPRYDRFFAARSQFWSTIGTVDDDVIAYLISPEFNGAPAWPTTRQAFRTVRPAGSLIIASDGLSDLFVDTNMQEPGFGCEVYLESPDLAAADFATIRASWQFALIESLARNVANWGGIDDQLERLGVISLELPAPPAMPERWITPSGNVGALVNMQVPGRPMQCTLEADAIIRVAALTILLPDETAHVIAGRAAARADIAQRLIAAGTGLTCPADRRSVLA